MKQPWCLSDPLWRAAHWFVTFFQKTSWITQNSQTARKVKSFPCWMAHREWETDNNGFRWRQWSLGKVRLIKLSVYHKSFFAVSADLRVVISLLSVQTEVENVGMFCNFYITCSKCQRARWARVFFGGLLSLLKTLGLISWFSKAALVLSWGKSLRL